MDLSRLRPVFDAVGPFLTLHLEVGRTDENGVEQQEARWTRVRHDLEHGKYDEKLVEQVGERLLENTHVPGEVRRTIVANADSILLDDVQAGHSHYPEVVDHGDLPELSGWLAHEDMGVPFVLAVVDRVGADIDVHWALSRPAVASETVTGSDLYITKVHPGAWSDRSYDQNVENTWRRNADEVADAVHSLVREHRPRAVLVAGDVRARTEVVGALEREHVDQLASILQVESGGRGEGASEEALWDEVRGHLRDLAATAEAEVTAALDEARGRAEGAATGLDEVLEALAKAQVERLVVDLGALEDKTVTPRRHPGLALPEPAASADELPAARALVAAAALTGAQLTLAPAEMTRGGGVSALLRWSDNAPAEPTDTV